MPSTVGQNIIERLRDFNEALAGRTDKQFRVTTVNRRTGVTVSQYRRVLEILREQRPMPIDPTSI